VDAGEAGQTTAPLLELCAATVGRAGRTLLHAVDCALERLSLADFANRSLDTLSVGELRRVC
jgi:ABC-type Mn2+/Zn2+ transport system ATPase subunit